MPKTQKANRIKKRYVCQKCGRKDAVKHDKGRFRCLSCHSIYGPNSRNTCYNKEEYLVLKTLLQLFRYKEEHSRKNSKFTLEEFTKTLKEQSADEIKKLVELNVLNRIDFNVKQRILDTDLEDMLILTKDKYGRFQLYTNLLKKNELYNFKHDIVTVRGGDKYHYDNKSRELEKEIEALKQRRRLSLN